MQMQLGVKAEVIENVTKKRSKRITEEEKERVEKGR
jgi:hypothetical protein